MIRSIRPIFVEFIPRDIVNGILYISRKFNTASHLCCCGCGLKIVTPLRNTEYRLIEKGDLVSLHPSIGNWNLPCQSHYWIRDNQIVWARKMTKEEIQSGRYYHEALQQAYFDRVTWPWWKRSLNGIKKWLSSLLK